MSNDKGFFCTTTRFKTLLFCFESVISDHIIKNIDFVDADEDTKKLLNTKLVDYIGCYVHNWAEFNFFFDWLGLKSDWMFRHPYDELTTLSEFFMIFRRDSSKNILIIDKIIGDLYNVITKEKINSISKAY